MFFHRGTMLHKYVLAMHPHFPILLFAACLDVRRVASVAQTSRERSNFLSLLQKSLLREKKRLHLERINTGSDRSKMDDTSDPLNLLEQKVVRPFEQDVHSSRENKDRPSRAAC